MGLRKLFWPFGDTDEKASGDGSEQEFDGAVGNGMRDSRAGEPPSKTAGMDSERPAGVMEAADVEDPSRERTVLGKDESASLHDGTKHSGGSQRFDDHDERDDDSGKSPEAFLSGDLGEEDIQTQDDPETNGSDIETEETEDTDGDASANNQTSDKDEDAPAGEDSSGAAGEGSSYNPETVRSSTPEHRSRHGENDDTFMELPEACVTEQESPDPDASAEEMLPEVLPGWDLQKTDQYRWQRENAQDYINATYRDPQSRRYMVHVSKWKPSHITYALDELYGFGEPNAFDLLTARGQFVFAVKIVGGTVDDARTLLMACPALSQSYFQGER